jgi:hypothetical protein
MLGQNLKVSISLRIRVILSLSTGYFSFFAHNGFWYVAAHLIPGTGVSMMQAAILI